QSGQCLQRRVKRTLWNVGYRFVGLKHMTAVRESLSPIAVERLRPQWQNRSTVLTLDCKLAYPSGNNQKNGAQNEAKGEGTDDNPSCLTCRCGKKSEERGRENDGEGARAVYIKEV